VFDEQLNNLTAVHQRTFMDVTEFTASTAGVSSNRQQANWSGWLSHVVEGAGMSVHRCGLKLYCIQELHRQTRSRLRIWTTGNWFFSHS
jgi:hypothetical protein